MTIITMAVTPSMKTNLKRYMVNNGYTCTEEWLQACVDWVEANETRVTDATLQKQVYDQWVDANLTELTSSCLPPNLVSHKTYQLTGKFGLQVNSVMDVGESAYSQWQKLQKLENENLSATASTNTDNAWAPKPRRCLYLTLTDGTQEVFGMELKPIPFMSLSNLKPGIKVVVTGPVECRRGILQLCPNNIKVIGGEVESLLEKNSVVAAIQEKLHLRGTPPNDILSPRQHPPGRPGTASTIASMNTDTDTEMDMDNMFSDNMDDDDLLFMEIDENMLSSAPSTSTVVNRHGGGRNTESTGGIIGYPDMSTLDTEVITLDDDDGEFHNVANSSRPIQNASIRNQGSSHTRGGADGKKSTPLLPFKRTTTTVVPREDVNMGTKVKKVPQIKTTRKEKEGNGSTGKSAPQQTKAKQLKIDGYMKPLPVVIKPATPKIKPQTAPTPIMSAELDASLDMFAHEQDEEDEEFMNFIDDRISKEIERSERNQTTTGHPHPAAYTTGFRGGEEDLMNVSRTSEGTPERKTTGIVQPITPCSSRPGFPVIVSSEPFVYIKQIKDCLEGFVENKKTVKVKGCIATLTSSITPVNGEWTLTVSLNDGTGFLNCSISSQLLNEIIGFDPKEMKMLKRLKTSASKQQIEQGLTKLTTKMVHSNAIFSVALHPDTEPTIVEISDVLLHHVNCMRRRSSILR